MFPLTASEKKAIVPLPPGASMEELSDRLIQLEDLRYKEYVKLMSHEATARNIARYEADATMIGITMHTTALRINLRYKAAGLGFISTPWPSFPDRPLPKKLRDLVNRWEGD